MKVGRIVLAIAATHEVVGVVLTWPTLVEIADAGVFAAVPDTEPWRLAAFWFHICGLLMALVGWSWKTVEDTGQRVASGPVLGFAAMCALGAFCMPVSGFWFGFLVLLHRATGQATLR